MMWQNGGMSGLDQWNFVMHPVDAALTCDPNGHYVRQWCPELSALPDDFIHKPWKCPPSILCRAGVKLGEQTGDISSCAKRGKQSRVLMWFLPPNFQTWRPFSQTKSLLSYTYNFNTQSVINWSIICPPIIFLLNLLSADYLLTIIMKFPNCPRPWWRIVFPQLSWPGERHLYSLWT